MSWSYSAFGTPEKIAANIEAQSEKYSGQSKVEFDAAKPHLIALLRQNFATDGHGYSKPFVMLNASGSGSSIGGEMVQSSCSVKIEAMYGTLLV